jgi:hypothetical protein
MITVILFFGAGMIGAAVINYILHEPNKRIEDYDYWIRKQPESED